ncbi:MAG: DUF6261 family protein [Bacteroidota bacterium]|nr:DUF6261 family protein [Bacteroidota bacterium]
MEKKLKPVPLHFLRVAELVQFNTEVSGIVTEKSSVIPELKPFSDKYNADVAGITKYLATVRGNEHSESIGNEDSLRDGGLTAIFKLGDAFSHIPGIPAYEAANNVLRFMEHYGRDLIHKDDAEETAQITALVDAVETTPALLQDFTTINALPALNQIKTANINVASLLQERSQEETEKVGKYVSSNRKQIVAAYRKLEKAINLFAEDSTNEAYTQLIGQLNNRIAYYQSLADAHKDDPETPDASGPSAN